MKKQSIFSGEFLVVICSVLWGIISLFTIPLIDLGFDSLSITYVRSIFSCIFIAIYILIFNKKLFIIKIKDLIKFIFLGAVCYCFMCTAYSFSIKINGAGLSTMLLYTSPIWTILLSVFFFNSRVGKKEIICLFGILIGCALLTLGNLSRISSKGIIVGLLSGILLAGYGVGSKLLSKKYRAITITFYSFLFSTISSFFCSKGWKTPNIIINNPKSISYIVFLSVFITVVPYLLYNYALVFISSSKASMISSIEIVVASICGVFAFNNKLSAQEIFGMTIELLSIILMNIKLKIKNKKLYLEH